MNAQIMAAQEKLRVVKALQDLAPKKPEDVSGLLRRLADEVDERARQSAKQASEDFDIPPFLRKMP